MEDPLFEPWSVQELTPPEAERPNQGQGAVELLRTAGTAGLQAVSQRLRLARHETSLEDLLDAPPHLLRFELKPWSGPWASSGSRAPAMLEIGLGPSDEVVAAWYWLDRPSEAPDETATVATVGLTSSWIERIILDFVGKALARR
jgi:hypothetical protein